MTASKGGYETSSFVTYDARDITIFLVPPAQPGTGPFPPGRQVGHIFGHVLFGDATGIGSSHWNLVPEPRTPTEVKRAYVVTTVSTIYSGAYPPSAPIDYHYDPAVSAWSFDMVSRPAALAVVAIAGLYDPARDPSGLGVTGFEPFAMGVTRGILVGPGQDVFDIDVVVNIPLDAAMRVDLDEPPALNTFPWPGPTHYELVPFLDFGGEGVVVMNKGPVPLVPAPEPEANVYMFPDGEQNALLSGMAPLVGNLADASYTLAAGAYSAGGGNPFSVRIVRGVTDLGEPIVISDFLGMPRPTDPFPGTVGTGLGLHFRPEGPSMGEATFNMHILSTADGTALFRIFTRGDVFDVDLPNLTGAGFPPTPAYTDVAWFFYRITIPGLSFDQFNYGHLNENYWSAYAADAYYVQFPATLTP